MPFNRPTLTELRQRNAAFIQSELKNIGALLRFSNMGILGDADAGLTYLHYGYLDWIAQQATPYTATDEYLSAWAALKNVFQKPAAAGTCPSVQYTGTAGAIIPAGAVLNRADGYQYTIDSVALIGGTGAGTVAITAVLPDPTTDPTGGGAAGNLAIGTVLTLDAAISGVSSAFTCNVAITDGADIETEAAFRARMLLAYQNTAQGGNNADYREWALDVPGVTRAWVTPKLMGAGTVGVYIMLDGDNTTNEGGFPVGTNGISQHETWGATKTTSATGNQLTVADYIYALQPVTALVYVCSPIATAINFTFSGLTNASAATTTAIAAAIDNLFFQNGAPGGTVAQNSVTVGTIYLSDIMAAIADIPETEGFILTAPAANVVMPTGGLPVLGTVTYL